MNGNDQPPRENDFFEKHVGEYSKSKVRVNRAVQTFALDASF
jgi:hypothetical protein